MQVETYEEISLDTDVEGNVVNELVSEEALALIETLGLTGQQALVEKHTLPSGDTAETRFPYRRITVEERNVFKAVFPSVTELTQYELGPLPLRVLQVASHAKDCFEHLEVWHAKSQREDPVLVGMRKEGQYNQPTFYLLARWGDALVPFEELRAMAKKRLEASVSLEIKSLKQKLAALEGTLSESLDVYLQGESFPSIYAHVSPR